MTSNALDREANRLYDIAMRFKRAENWSKYEVLSKDKKAVA